MKSYSYKKFESELNEKFKIEVIDENVLTDFLKVAKKKFFDDNILISSEVANEVKKIFSKTFISSFSSELKFKTFSLSNLVYKPSKVITTIQNKLLEILQTEFDRPNLSRMFKFTPEDTEYKKNTSLLAECYNIVNEMESWIKENLNLCLAETYQLNSISMKSKENQRFVSGFREVFLEIFEKKNNIFRFNMSLDDFSERNDFSYLAYRVIKALKKETKNAPQKLDIENMYVNDELYSPDDSAPLEITDDQADKLVKLLSVPKLYSAIREYGKKYNKSILSTDYPQYIDIYKVAYREAILRSKSLKTPPNSVVLEIMHEYITSLESTTKPSKS